MVSLHLDSPIIKTAHETKLFLNNTEYHHSGEKGNHRMGKMFKGYYASDKGIASRMCFWTQEKINTRKQTIQLKLKCKGIQKVFKW